MKLFKRIKAEHAANPLESMTPEKVTYVPKPLTEQPFTIMSDGSSSVAFDYGVIEQKVKDTLAQSLAEKIDAEMIKGSPAQTETLAKSMLTTTGEKTLLGGLPTLTELKKSLMWPAKEPSKHHDSFLAFPNPAKGGHIIGVWRVVVEKIEVSYATGKYAVRFRVIEGQDTGSVHVLHEGDTLSVNASVGF